jgi:large repetitive protein
MTGLPTLDPEIADLGLALGLFTSGSGGVEFDSSWFDDPGNHLAGVLGDDNRRSALVRFADAVLGEGQHTESGGVTYVHLFDLRTLAGDNNLPDVTVQVALDARPASYVEVGVAARLATASPPTSTQVVIPLYRAAKPGQHVAQPFALLAGGVVELSTDLTFTTPPPATDKFGLAGVSINVSTPLTGSQPPSFGLVLKGLHLPGATESLDLPIGAPGANIEQTLLSLVLGLVRQAEESLAGQAAAEVGAALSLLGLGAGSQIPALPVADLVAHGPGKLRDWFVAVMGDATARGHWLQALADLLGGTVQNGMVTVQLGGGPVRADIGFDAAPGPSGHLLVTPTLGLDLGLDVAGSIRLGAGARADLLTIDTATGALAPVPDVEIAVTAVGTGAGNAALLLHTAKVDIGSVRLGLAVRNGTPQALLQALDVSVDGHPPQAVVDLSTPDAIVSEAGQVAGTLIGDLLDNLGPAGAGLKGLLGIVGTGGMPPLDAAHLFTDPLGTLAGWWHDLLANHPADVPAVLQLLRNLVAAPSQVNTPVAIADPNVGPWSIPIAPDVTLDVSLVDGKVAVEPVVSMRVDNLAGGCTVVVTQLRTRLATFDLVGRHAEFPLAVTLAATLKATGANFARLALGPVAIVADYIGVTAAWSPATPFNCGFAAPNLGIDTGQAVIPLVLPSVDEHGHVNVPVAMWGSVEMLFGVLAASADQSWLSDLVDLVGWRLGAPPRGPKLSLAALVANPAAEVKAWLGALATTSDLVSSLTSTLAHIIGGSADGLAGVFSGTGTPEDPWLASLGGSASLPAIAVWMTPHGPVLAPSLAGEALTAWRPGAPGLPPDGLAVALSDEARAGGDVAALAAHRENLGSGLAALAGRWTGTDGLVAPPSPPVAGLTAVTRPDLDWSGLASLDLAQVVGAALPPVVVKVAISPVAQLPWTPGGGRLLDLTQPGVAPDSFSVSSVAAGEWVVALAPRSDATLGGATDPSGVVGQSQRLIQVLQQLSSAGQIALVAVGGAGHAARLAADQVSGVSHLITLGTPWSGATFDSARTGVPADALRLMKALLPAVGASDDDDLKRGSALVTGMFAAARRAPWITDLEAPRPDVAIRAGLSAYGVFGVLSEGAVLRAMTAVFAAGLAGRAQARVAAASAQPDATVVGIRVPFSFLAPPGGHGTTLTGAVLLTLASVARADAATTARPTISLDFSIADTDAWLVGGPGTTPVGGAAPLELRHITGHVGVGLHGEASEATLTLNEGAALGSDWVSIVVEPPTQATGELEPQPLLPEAQALLSALTSRLAAETPTSPAGLFAGLLQAVGVTQADGALVPDALTHLLHDPGSHIRSLISSPSARDALLTTFAALVPGMTATGGTVALTAGPLTAQGNLTARTIGFSAAGDDGLLHWNAGVSFDAAGHPTLSAGIGDPKTDAFALEVQSGPARAQLLRPGGGNPVALFPTPDIDGLAKLAAAAVPAEAVRLILEALRGISTGLGAALDALTDALGMLKPPDAQNHRAIACAVGLFEDPAAWFKQAGVLSLGGGALDTTKVVDLLEALKPFIGLAGTPRGTWPVTQGVTVTVSPAADGPNVALAIDATSWLAGAGGGRAPFAAGVSVGLTLPSTAAPHPAIDVFIGVPDGPNGTSTPQHRQAAHLVIDGTHVTLLLRPASGSDIEIFPNPSGLGALFSAGVQQVLPLVLNQLAAMTGDAVRTEIASLVGDIGVGLALASGAPAVFDANAIKSLAADPGSYLRTHLGAMLTQAGPALDSVLVRLLGLGAGQHAATLTNGVLTVAVRTVQLVVNPSPLGLSVHGHVSTLPVIGSVALSLAVDPTGLSGWSAQVGPAALDLGGPVLRPFARVTSAAGAGWETDVGLGLDALAPDATGHQELTARWRQTSGLAMLVTKRTDPSTLAEDHTEAGVAAAAIDAVIDLVGGWVLGVADVQALLAKQVGANPAHTVRTILDGSILQPASHPPALLPGVLTGWPGKLLAIASQLAACAPTVDVGPVKLGIANNSGVLGVSLDLVNGVQISGGDTTLTLEVDASWIDPPVTPGIVLELLKVSGQNITPAPGIAVDGLGLRLGKAGGPLIDAGLRLDTIAVHLFGSVVMNSANLPSLGGGVEIELGGLAVPLGSGGGDNAVAQGIMHDAGGSGAPPRPAFSPALAVQGHGQGVQVSLRAGSGDGPWYLPIQRAFGPVYLEQIGLGVAYRQNLTPRQLEMISLYLDGQVSLLGLTASVQNLRFGYHVSRPFFDPSSWEVDVDGFAIAADFGPLTLAGGLAKFPLESPLSGVQYLGMLKIGYAAYSIDMFGGYAHPTTPSGTQFASFFAFGVLHAPLGGPPAFFITGVGIGFGINRELKTPTIDEVNTHPFMLALRAGGPSPEPMKQLQDMSAIVGPHQGEFWVAAGVSFTSFVLITGEILVTVQFGDGLEVAILGLARAQLPTAQLTLVSIELALLARFSTKEGLLLVQAQLTENSWLLDKSVRLTGGFAFATWWKGPNAGQFVITVGGYHPRFHHDGYPTVPRVGLSWQPADFISVVGGVYFALCSEAIMAGAGLHVAAHLGPAHATLDFGGDGIVFFDPFYFIVDIYAEASVGITIWLLFGTVDIDISLGFDVTVEGPPIYVHGSFSICGIDIPFSFGSQSNPADRALDAPTFAAKYLRGDHDAQVVQAGVLKGALTAGKSDAPNSGGVDKPPDGSADHPFRLVPEFLLTFVTTAPAQTLELTCPAGKHTATVSAPGLGVAPMYSATLDSGVTVNVTSDSNQPFDLNAVGLTPRTAASFPKGVWGPAQNPDAKTVPAGDTVDACDGLTVDTTLPASMFTGAPPIDYHQVELPLTGRKPLPFVTNRANTDQRVTDAKALRDAAKVLTAGNPDADQRFIRTARVMSAAGTGLTTTASLRGERAAPPSFGSLADDLADSPNAVSPSVTGVVVDRTKPAGPRYNPRIKSVMGVPLDLTLQRQANTTVANTGSAVARNLPTLAGARAATAGVSQLALHTIPRAVRPSTTTLLPVGSAPLTRLASGTVGAVANARPTPASAARLTSMSADLVDAANTGGGARARATDTNAQGAVLHEGELAVITISNRPTGQKPDTLTVSGGATRVICVAAGGRVLLDDVVGTDGQGTIPLPNPTERVAVVALGTSAGAGGHVPGWYAGQSLPSLGWGMALGGGAVVTAQGYRVPTNRERGDGGWMLGRELVTASVVVTSFTAAVSAIAIVVDDQLGGDAAAKISMHLADAERGLDASGEPLPPQVLVDGTRSILIYAVQTTGANPRVFVEHCALGELAGVFGSPAGVADLAGVLAASGAAAAAQQPLVGGPGLRRVSIVLGDGALVPPAPTPPGKPAGPIAPRVTKAAPAKKSPAKKAAPAKKTAAKKTTAKKAAKP